MNVLPSAASWSVDPKCRGIRVARRHFPVRNGAFVRAAAKVPFSQTLLSAPSDRSSTGSVRVQAIHVARRRVCPFVCIGNLSCLAKVYGTDFAMFASLEIKRRVHSMFVASTANDLACLREDCFLLWSNASFMAENLMPGSAGAEHFERLSKSLSTDPILIGAVRLGFEAQALERTVLLGGAYWPLLESGRSLFCVGCGADIPLIPGESALLVRIAQASRQCTSRDALQAFATGERSSIWHRVPSERNSRGREASAKSSHLGRCVSITDHERRGASVHPRCRYRRRLRWQLHEWPPPQIGSPSVSNSLRRYEGAWAYVRLA